MCVASLEEAFLNIAREAKEKEAGNADMAGKGAAR